ncbi:MAG: FAD:protein FMN transferase [Planctomycetota bacterium]|jgi:thiamine biosynthesis lipoprotein
MSRKSNRRDFLRGTAAANAMAHMAQEALPEASEIAPGAEPVGGAYLVRLSRTAMACQFEVFLNAGQYPGGTEASLGALDLIDALEDQLTVFRDTSEISRLNRHGADGPVEVESRLFELLELALLLHAETDGAFDVTSGPLWKLWGFAWRSGAVPSDEELADTLHRVGSDLVVLDPTRQTVRFKRSGVELNLGSVGKGYALDRSAETMAAAGIDDFLLNGGRSSVLARGAATSSSWPPSEGRSHGWVVGIGHPVHRRRRLAEVRLRDRGLATSGARSQSFRRQGRTFGHILDPRTGRPAEGLLSVTVAAPTAARADALSTAFFVMGLEKSIEHCRQRPEIGAILVSRSPRGEKCRIDSIGFGEDELRTVNA